MLKRYLTRQIQTIAEDRVLRWYGVAVSLLLTVTAVAWTYAEIWRLLTPSGDVICWPMLPNCRELRVLDADQLRLAMYALGVGSLVPAGLFATGRGIAVAWWALLGLNVVKHALILLDFQMRLNQHLMAFWVTLAFLFLPAKRTTLKLLVVLFYFWAGVLKLTPEWLTGAALYAKPWPLDGPLLPWATGYVLVLEIALIWALLWERSKAAWLTLAQLIVFHLYSFLIVSFFYPLVMFAILAIFPLSWCLDPKAPPLVSELTARRLAPASLVVAALFSFLQILPKLFPGDTAVTGQGRLLSVHMFDAYTSCQSAARVRMKQGPSLRLNLYRPMAPRIHCDPIVHLSRARNVCYKNRNNRRFEDVDLLLRSKRTTDSELRTIVDLKNVCTEPVRYRLFWPNAWISP